MWYYKTLYILKGLCNIFSAIILADFCHVHEILSVVKNLREIECLFTNNHSLRCSKIGIDFKWGQSSCQADPGISMGVGDGMAKTCKYYIYTLT